MPERRDAMFRGDAINVTEGRAGAAHRAAQPRRHAGARRRRGRDARGQRGARRAWRAFADGRARAATIDGVDGGRVHRRRQHRHRRLGPRPGDGDAGARALPRRAAAALRLERRRRAYRTTRWHGSIRARTLVIVASKTFTTIETMTNARTAQAWLRGDAGRRRRRAFRRRLDRARQDRGLRHRPRARLRLLGLGRRALFGVGRGRPAADDRDRAGALRRVPGGAHDDGPALRRRRRCPRTCRCCSGSSGSGTATSWATPSRAVLPYDQRLAAAARLPPAARHGEQRQVA